MRIETMSNPLPSGAGRFVDYIWPDPLQYVSTAAAVTNCRNRLLNTTVAFATGGFGGGGATLTLLNLAAYGYPIARLTGGGADGVGQIARFNSGTAPAVFQVQTKGGIVGGDQNDLACARVFASYAYNAFGGGSPVADSGLECTGGGGLIQSQSTIGVGFCRSATNVITARCQTVGGGASSNVSVTGAGTGFPAFNSALLHTYELQFTSATPTVEATVRWLIDGVSVRALSYGVGTVLPPLQPTVNTCFTAMVVNVGALVNIDVAQFRIVQAPTIAACF